MDQNLNSSPLFRVFEKSKTRMVLSKFLTINNKLLVIIIFSFVFLASSCSLNSYRIKEDFIIPPNFQNLTNSSNKLKHKYEDFTITIGQLNGDYNNCVDRVDKAIITNECSTNCNAKLFDISTSPISITIKIHFHNIYKSVDPSKATQQMALQLLTDIDADTNKKSWAKSITQNIVEKIFEVVPVPQQASLSRFGYDENDLYSILLLNPKFQLTADLASSKFKEIEGKKYFLTEWNGTSTLDFYRSKTGDIKQFPYLSLNKTHFPTNKIRQVKSVDQNDNPITTTFYNIAGSADLELSSKITNSKYIALYQPLLRSNNLSEPTGSTDINNCCINTYDCNSQLVFNENIDLVFNPKKCIDKIPIYSNVGVVGERSFIQVQQTVFINNMPIKIPFKTNIRQLVDKGLVTNGFKIYRIHNGRLVMLKVPDNLIKDLLLLPTDHIFTQ